MGKRNRFLSKNVFTFVLAIEIIMILYVHLSNIHSLYGFFLSEDELGYWGNAAYFLGKNWGNSVQFCPYYSFGYSFFLLPILALPVSPLTKYHLAIILNAFFIVGAFIISLYLFIRLFPDMNRIFISIACTAMALYAAYVSWSSVTWSECCLVFFVWLILLQVYLIIQKESVLRIVIFAIELGYIYMIHQRTISFLIAGVIYILILCFIKKVTIKKCIVFMGTIFAMLMIASLIKSHLQGAIYDSGNITNDYTSLIAGMNLSNMIIPVLREVGGQFLYLWLSSFGIIPLGIGFSIATMIKKWKEKDTICWFYGFIILSFLGLLGISSIAMRLAVGRVDQLIYGRYNEIAIGFFIIFGLVKMIKFIEQKDSFRNLIISTVFLLFLVFLFFNKIHNWNISLDTYFQGVCAAGIYWFVIIVGGGKKWFLELCAVVLVEEIILFLFLKVVKKNKWIILAEILFLIGCWTISGEMVLQNQIVPYQRDNIQPLVNNAYIWEFMSENDKKVAFLSSGYNIRGSIQFYMEDIPLECISDISELDELNHPDILIVDGANSIIDRELNHYSFEGFIGSNQLYFHESTLSE